MRGRRAAATLALAGLAALTGCTAALPVAEAAPPAVEVAVGQTRSDVAAEHLSISVTNAGDADLELERATFTSARFDGEAVWQRGTTVPAGSTRDLRVDLPASSCDPDASGDTITLVALVDGEPLEFTVTPTDPHEQLAALAGSGCARRELAATAELTLVPPAPGAVGAVGELVLRLTPRAAGGDVDPGTTSAPATVAITSIGSTTLFAPVASDGRRVERLPIALEAVAGGAPSEVSVPLAPNRCDAHALAEDKQGTLFPIDVTTAGGTTSITTETDDGLRGALFAFWSAACGLPD